MSSRYAVYAGFLLIALPVLGDDLDGANRLLCVPGSVSHCVADRGCDNEPPEAANVPDFIEVDLRRKTLSTTRASGENRSTAVQHRISEGGRTYLMGVENGRAFVLAIADATGDMTFLVGTDRESGSMFGHCTPDD